MATYSIVIDDPDQLLALKHLLARDGKGMDEPTFVRWLVTRRLDDVSNEIRMQVQQLANISDEQFEVMTQKRAEAKEAKRLMDEAEAQRKADEAARLQAEADRLRAQADAMDAAAGVKEAPANG